MPSFLTFIAMLTLSSLVLLFSAKHNYRGLESSVILVLLPLFICVAFVGNRFVQDKEQGWAHDSFVSSVGDYDVVPSIHQNNDSATVDYIVPALNRTLRHLYKCDKRVFNCSEIMESWNATDTMRVAMYGSYAKAVTDDTPTPSYGHAQDPFVYASFFVFFWFNAIMARTFKGHVSWWLAMLCFLSAPVAMLGTFLYRPLTTRDIVSFMAAYLVAIPAMLEMLRRFVPRPAYERVEGGPVVVVEAGEIEL